MRWVPWISGQASRWGKHLTSASSHLCGFSSSWSTENLLTARWWPKQPFHTQKGWFTKGSFFCCWRQLFTWILDKVPGSVSWVSPWVGPVGWMTRLFHQLLTRFQIHPSSSGLWKWRWTSLIVFLCQPVQCQQKVVLSGSCGSFTRLLGSHLVLWSVQQCGFSSHRCVVRAVSSAFCCRWFSADLDTNSPRAVSNDRQRRVDPPRLLLLLAPRLSLTSCTGNLRLAAWPLSPEEAQSA